MNEAKDRKTAKRIGIAILVLAAVICGALVLGLLAFYVYDTKPWKVKDPSNPKFDVSKFDPNDYRNHEELAVILRQLLAPGVSTKTDLDMLWCKQTPCGRVTTAIENSKNSAFIECAAKIGTPSPTEHVYWYSKRGKTDFFGGWYVWAYVNEEQRVTKLCADDVVVF